MKIFKEFRKVKKKESVILKGEYAAIQDSNNQTRIKFNLNDQSL